MILLALAIVFLACVLIWSTLTALDELDMKTLELTAAIDGLRNATTELSASVNKAVAVLMEQGQPSTPDNDIVPLIEAIGTLADSATNLKAKLDAALTPPQP
jgi:uncharacterized protein YoxC